MAEFLEDPERSPDISCAEDRAIEFITEKNTLIAPGTTWLAAQAYALEMTTVLHTPNFFLGLDRVLVGIDRSFAWIYAIPIAIALVSMAMVGLAVIAWKNGYWDKRRRIYYGVTAGMAIAYTLFLANAGQLTVFF